MGIVFLKNSILCIRRSRTFRRHKIFGVSVGVVVNEGKRFHLLLPRVCVFVLMLWIFVLVVETLAVETKRNFRIPYKGYWLFIFHVAHLCWAGWKSPTNIKSSRFRNHFCIFCWRVRPERLIVASFFDLWAQDVDQLSCFSS